LEKSPCNAPEDGRVWLEPGQPVRYLTLDTAGRAATVARIDLPQTPMVHDVASRPRSSGPVRAIPRIGRLRPNDTATSPSARRLGPSSLGGLQKLEAIEVLASEPDLDPLRTGPDFRLMIMDLVIPNDPFAG
jgi:hypothetical protein